MADYIALVFTDLVNSTAVKDTMLGNNTTERNQSYRDKILFPHRKRVIESLGKYKGRVVEPPQGDGFLLEFPSPVKAIQWAVFIQCNHIKEPIRIPSGVLEVKIGIHYGAPLRDGDRFIGQEVDYAARVAALASGKQILLSKTMGVLIEDDKIKGISIHPYGEHLLKGIGTVSIFELIYDEFKETELEMRTIETITKEEYSEDFQYSKYNAGDNYLKTSSNVELAPTKDKYYQEKIEPVVFIKSVSNTNITPSFLKYCKRELASFIGPIASFLVDDILSDNPKLTQQQLVELLVAEIPDFSQAKLLKQTLLDLSIKE